MSGEPRTRPQRSWLGLLIPAVLAFAVLVGLGTWQVQRKAWKEALIASLTQRTAAPPVALPPRASWAGLDPPSDEFTHVKFSASFDHANEALVYAVASAFRSDVSGPGAWVFTPARLAAGGIVMVNRGFVPQARQDPASRPQGQVSGPADLVGVMRWPETPGMFTPAAEPDKNLWFSRDPLAIAAAKGFSSDVAPFYIEQEAPVPPGGLPHPAAVEVHLRNEHLQYAITWYGLAIVLVVVFLAWARSSGRSGAGMAGNQGPGTA